MVSLLIAESDESVPSRSAVFVVFLLIAIVHLSYALLAIVPLVRPDEAGYLMNAAALAGYRSDMPLPYFPGYSLFLVPAFWTGLPMEYVYLIVKLINTAFFTGTFALLYILVSRLRPGEDRRQILMAVFVVSFYPAFLAYNALALSENAFIFFFLLSTLILFRLEKGQAWVWIGFGATLGMLYMTHPKSLPVLMAALAVASWQAWKERGYIEWLTGAIVFGLFYFATQELKQHLLGLMTFRSDPAAISSSYPTVSSKFENLLDWEGIAHFIGNLFGQSFYLVIATLGLAVFGAAVVYSHLRKKDAAGKIVWIYLALVLVGTVIMSAATHAVPNRLDHVLYGRYNEGIIAPFLVLGILAAPRDWRAWLWVLILALALSTGLYVFLELYPKDFVAYISMTGFYYYFFLFSNWHFFNPFLLFISFAIIVLIWLGLSVSTKVRFYPMALAVFFAVSALLGFDLLLLSSKAAELGTRNTVSYVTNSVKPGTCINHDETTQSIIKIYLYKAMLYKYPLVRLQSDASQSFCSEWLLSDSEKIGERFPGAELIVAEEHNRSKIWRVTLDEDASAE